MGLAIQLCSWLLWFPLKVLGINAVFRAGVGRYPLIFTYMVVTFLFAAVQAPVALIFHRSDRNVGDWYQILHSVGEGSTYTLILAVVLSLIYRATTGFRPRRLVRLVLPAAGLVFIGVSFLVHYDKKVALGVWMTPWARDLHFGAAILDLALWGLLIGQKKKDSHLLLLTGGMGVMFAGEAIGESIRSAAIPYQSYSIYMFGHVVMVLADAAFLYIWWQAFRKEAANRIAIGRSAPAVLLSE